MKILHVSGFLEYNFGGAEQVTRDLIPRLGLGHSALCFDGGTHRIDGEVTRLPIPNTDREWFKRRVIFAPTGILRDIPDCVGDADIIHCHDMHVLEMVADWATKSNKPLVVTCHQNMPYRLTGALSWVANVSLARRDALRRKALKSARIIVCPSEFCRDAIERFIEMPATTTVIPNWIDSDLQSASRNCELNGVIYAGRLSTEKGVGLLLDALDMVPATPVCIVGRGPLEKTVKERRWAWFPELPHPELLRLASKYAVGVIPSVVDESFSLTALEYRYLSLKIVATPSGAVPEVLSGYPNVWWSHAAPSALARHISLALESEHKPDTGFSTFTIKHNSISAVRRYQEIYEEILAEPFDPVRSALVYPYGQA